MPDIAWKDVPVATKSDDAAWQDVPADGAKPKGWLDSAVDVGKGLVKGALESAQGLQRFENFGVDPTTSANPYPAGSKEAQTYAKVQSGAKDFNENLVKSRNTAQSIGKGIEAVGEAFVPIPGLEEVNAATKGSRLLKNAPKILKTGAGVAAQEGARGTILGTAKTGSVKEGLKQGATASLAAPIAGALTTGTGKMLSKSAQKLYQRFLIPGGGPNYNKQVAKDAAAELIKRGTFALSKPGFTRKMEQSLMDADQQVQAAEDAALEKMGYAPTGRYSYHIRPETVTTEDGPVIDVFPEEQMERQAPTGTGRDITVRPTPDQSVTRYGQVANREVGLGPVRPQNEVGPYLGAGEGAEAPRMSSRTRYKAERVAETRQGMLDVKPVLAKLRGAVQTGHVEGQQIVGYGGVNNARRRLIQQIRSLSTPNGHMDARSVIKLRRAWDRLLNWERTEGTGLKPGVKLAFEEAANAMRHEISEQVPDMREANAKYHFYAGVNKVLKDKENATVGHRAHGLIGNLGIMGAALGGYLHHGAEEAAALGLLAGFVDAWAGSGANLTGSALAFDRAGTALQNGKVAAAVNRLATAGSGVVRKQPQ